MENLNEISVSMTALPNIPLIAANDDLPNIILDSLKTANLSLKNRDVLVIAQKIVSKAEGRTVALDTVTPSLKACALAVVLNKDPRLVELILSESSEVIRCTKGDKVNGKEGLLIVRHRLGYVLANAGVDQSNVSHETKPHALLLPKDPDRSCENIRSKLKASTGVDTAVIINDSHGRAWREGIVGVALGVAGIPALLDLRGNPDLFKRKLKATQVGFADELSAAASLIMGQADEGKPVIHMRGISYQQRNASVKELLRPKDLELFL